MRPEIRQELEARLDKRLDDAHVALLSVVLDEEGEVKKAKERVRSEIWDQKTPINGVSPELILARPDYAGGEIYLVYVDDHLTYLQPHKPGPGFERIDKAEAKALADDHAAEIAVALATETLLTRGEELLSGLDIPEPVVEPEPEVPPRGNVPMSPTERREMMRNRRRRPTS